MKRKEIYYCCDVLLCENNKKKSQALDKKKFIGGGFCKFNVDKYFNKIPSNF